MSEKNKEQREKNKEQNFYPKAKIVCTKEDLRKEGICHPLFRPGTTVYVYHDDVFGISKEVVAEIANPIKPDLTMLLDIKFLNFIKND